MPKFFDRKQEPVSPENAVPTIDSETQYLNPEVIGETGSEFVNAIDQGWNIESVFSFLGIPEGKIDNIDALRTTAIEKLVKWDEVEFSTPVTKEQAEDTLNVEQVSLATVGISLKEFLNKMVDLTYSGFGESTTRKGEIKVAKDKIAKLLKDCHINDTKIFLHFEGSDTSSEEDLKSNLVSSLSSDERGYTAMTIHGWTGTDKVATQTTELDDDGNSRPIDVYGGIAASVTPFLDGKKFLGIGFDGLGFGSSELDGNQEIGPEHNAVLGMLILSSLSGKGKKRVSGHSMGGATALYMADAMEKQRSHFLDEAESATQTSADRNRDDTLQLETPFDDIGFTFEHPAIKITDVPEVNFNFWNEAINERMKRFIQQGNIKPDAKPQVSSSLLKLQHYMQRNSLTRPVIQHSTVKQITRPIAKVTTDVFFVPETAQKSPERARGHLVNSDELAAAWSSFGNSEQTGMTKERFQYLINRHILMTSIADVQVSADMTFVLVDPKDNMIWAGKTRKGKQSPRGHYWARTVEGTEVHQKIAALDLLLDGPNIPENFNYMAHSSDSFDTQGSPTQRDREVKKNLKFLSSLSSQREILDRRKQSAREKAAQEAWEKMTFREKVAATGDTVFKKIVRRPRG